MNLAWIAAGGVALHVLSHVLAQYAQWLLAKVMRGEHCFTFLEDLQRFVRWLLHGLAGQLHGHQRWTADEQEWQPELYGN